MTQNQPTMPWAIALRCTVIALVGLALALLPGSLAAHRPADLTCMALFGLGFCPTLLLLRIIELPSWGFVSLQQAYLILTTTSLMGFAWLVGLSYLRAKLNYASNI